MAWPKGVPNPHGGRRPGSRNRLNATLIEEAATLGLTVRPPIRLLYIAERAEREGDLELARKCYADAAPYFCPRLTTVDMAVAHKPTPQPLTVDDTGWKPALIEMWRSANAKVGRA
jgi:hypothetical protein